MTIGMHTDHIELSTRGFTDIIDITPDVQACLSASGFHEGSVLVFVSGATAGLTTVEFESGLERDLKDFFERIIPQEGHYHHNERWHDGNGFSHVRASLLKPGLTVPFAEGRLLLGTWQQIVLVDFDNRPRNRRLVVQFTGIRDGDNY